MSVMSSMFAQLRESVAAVTGTAPTITFRSGSVAALVQQLSEEEIMVAGGQAESGGFTATILQADITGPPVRNEAITADGRALKVLSWINRGGVTWEITAGDPAKE